MAVDTSDCRLAMVNQSLALSRFGVLLKAKKYVVS
jgi:hypothetical protein